MLSNAADQLAGLRSSATFFPPKSAKKSKNFTQPSATVSNSAPAGSLMKAEAFFWFEGFLLPICGTIGIVGNVLSVLVLKRRDLDLKASFANLG